MAKSLSLMYHEIYRAAPLPNIPRSAGLYHIPAASFEEHLRILRDSGMSVRLIRELAEDSQTPSVLITFDDGWRGAFEAGLELLQKFSLKATFFITRDFVGQRHFCSPADIVRADRAGMEIGIHGTSHCMLSSCTRDRIAGEWKTCKEFLENLLGHAVPSASLPGGDWSREIADSAAEAGIRFLCTSMPGINGPSTDRLKIKRIAVRETTRGADVRRWCRYQVFPEQASWLILQIPRRVLGMKHYALLRRKLLGADRENRNEIFTP